LRNKYISFICENGNEKWIILSYWIVIAHRQDGCYMTSNSG
jgi:hypothetical protein